MKPKENKTREDFEDAAEKEKFPGFVKPMLATLTEDYFDDPEWIYERKYDGERCLILIEDTEPTIYSRNEKELNKTYPELIQAFKAEDYPDLILDGEIVAFDGKLTSFSKLQDRMKIKDADKAKKAEVAVHLYLFDLIYLKNRSLEKVTLKTRKRMLKSEITWKTPIHYVSHRNEKGKKYHKESCQKGWEGIIAKDGQSTYVHSRSKKWLKFKCVKGQELVIGGFTEPQGERIGFGALHVGFYEDGKLRYAGKVGTGYDDAFLEEWRDKFEEIEQKSSPFEDYEGDGETDSHWLKPKYVGDFDFTEWTDDNKLRHPRFIGMRYDKDPEDVKKERPK